MSIGCLYIHQNRDLPESILFIAYLHGFHDNYVSSRRQIDDYSPHVVKRQRLGSPLIRVPPPHRPDQAAAGSSRSDFGRSYPSPPSRPHPQVPAVPESSNSLQVYAADKVRYIHMALTCS